MRKRGRGWRLALAGAAVAFVAAAIGIRVVMSRSAAPPPSCRVSVGSHAFTLSLDQTANATTIAAVGKRLAMPDHAVTIALAAALEESGLRNLAFGDRDSLGLFQQRPSQGWGTAAQVMTPNYAAAAFFEHLARVPAWETLPVTVAAQLVQRSATPDAYAGSEAEARALAIAMTGEVPAGLSCGVSDTKTPPTVSLEQTMAQELGVPTLGTPLSSARGWTVATWLVGHASEFRIDSVAFAGQVWSSADGQWRPQAPGSSMVAIERA